MYSCTLPSTSALDGGGVAVGGQRHTPAALPPEKTRYPLYRRLGGPQGRSVRVRKISPPTGIRSPDRSARSESLYRLSYPGPLFREQSKYALKNPKRVLSNPSSCIEQLDMVTKRTNMHKCIQASCNINTVFLVCIYVHQLYAQILVRNVSLFIIKCSTCFGLFSPSSGATFWSCTSQLV